MYSRIPQDERGSLGESVFASCPLLSGDIRASARFQDERVLIPLLPRWAVLFRGLKTFGPVISFCRNRCAVLGTVAAYPEVVSTPCGVSACGGAGDLKFFFPNWACAFVAVEEHAGDWLYTVEFQDAWGDVVHKIILTSESNFDSFTWWVKINHAPNPASGCLRELRSPSRVDGPASLCEGEVCLLSKDDFRRFLCRMIESEVSLRISVGNEGLVQAANVLPNRLQEDDASIYLGDNATGLQLRVGRLAEVSVHRSCSPSPWILKAYESEGFAACVITPAPGECSKKSECLLSEIRQLFSGER